MDDYQERNWVLWTIIAGVIMVGLFVCVIGGAIVWDRFGGGGDEPVAGGATDEPTALIVPTNPVTQSPSPEVADVTTVPTATLADQNATEPPEDGATLVPTVTIPPGGSVTAFRTETPFAIDGNLDGWSDYPSYASTFRVFTISDWDGTDDLSAFWRLAWDNDNLYIGVLVTDDTHVQTQSGNQIWRGDGIDMQIDTDRLGDLGPGISPDDYQITFSPGDFGGLPPSAFRFRGTSAGQMLDAVGHSITVRSQQSADGYILEASIPWIDIGGRPEAGAQLGLSLNANDNDSVGTARQEMMKSHISTRTFTNPSTWGILIIADETP